jgi:hypothetical protein
MPTVAVRIGRRRPTRRTTRARRCPRLGVPRHRAGGCYPTAPGAGRGTRGNSGWRHARCHQALPAGRSVSDAHALVGRLAGDGVTLAVGDARYPPDEPAIRVLTGALALTADLQAAVDSRRTREGLAVARTRGRLHGRPRSSTGRRSGMSFGATSRAATRSASSPNCSTSRARPSTARSAGPALPLAQTRPKPSRSGVVKPSLPSGGGDLRHG